MADGQALAEPLQQDIRAELNRLLGSAAFRNSKRCREFLQYIVEQTVVGQNGNLKERAIGIDLFGLPQDFDTSQHTIVRVTASETRKKLALYYQSENGTQRAVRIELPPGAYNAEFTWTPPAEPEPAAEVERVPKAEERLAIVTPREAGGERISRRWLVGGGAAAGMAIVSGAFWVWGRSGERKPGAVPGVVAASVPAVPAGGSGPVPVRIMAGATNPYLDRNGQTWGADQYFTGGAIRSRPTERIVRTLEPDLYRRIRAGDFRYDIPLAPGSYELHLHFAETGLSDFISAESSGEGQRVFRISANGKTLLDFFDVVADAAGTNTATERVFRDISPGEDGVLHLAFSPLRGSAMVSAIELLPSSPGRVQPVRIRSGWQTPWRDSGGGQWRADSYFLGGNALVRRTNPAQGRETSSPDDALFLSERWGHFSYSIPVADGRYRVTLRFCEGHLGPRNTGMGGLGSRVFDVYCNGVALLRDFDIMKEAGGEGKPLQRVFFGVRGNAQGKIVLQFVPVVGMACVNGIEVVEPGNS